ncbi:MAG TPA: hypothetical protein VGE07_24160 [Herpetosiphonaceae bacterium]
MFRQWKSMILGAALLVLLSGCIAQKTETTLKGDGSGTNVMKTGLSEEARGFMESAGSESGSGSEAEDPFATVREQVKEYPPEWNVDVKDWKEDKFEGVEVSMEFSDIATLNKQLEALLEPSAANSGSPTGSMFQSVSAKEENGKYVISADVDTTSGGASDPSSAEFLKDAVVSWTITMPGAIEDYTAKEIATKDGNSVTWRFPLDKPGKYELSITGAKSGGALGGGSSLPLILGGVGALVVLGGVGFMVMNRNKKKPVAVDAGSYGGGYQQGGYQQPYDPNAGYGQQQQGGYQQPYDPNDPTRR